MTISEEQIKKEIISRTEIQTTDHAAEEPELKHAKTLDCCYITNQDTTKRKNTI